MDPQQREFKEHQSVQSHDFLQRPVAILTKFLLKNNYIDPSIQKGRILGVPGCLEHMEIITQLITEANEGKGDLTVPPSHPLLSSQTRASVSSLTSLKDSIQKASKELESWLSKVDNQVSQGSLRPGFTSILSCPDYIYSLHVCMCRARNFLFVAYFLYGMSIYTKCK